MIALIALLFACKDADRSADDPPTAEVPAAPTPGPRLVRRLTHSQYDHTVRDLLGVESAWGASFPPDDLVDGLDDDAGALAVGSLLADQYRMAAEALADEAVRTNRSALVPCDPEAIGAAACAIAFVVDFGRRAFRRPLTAEEAERWFAVWDAGRQGEGFDAGVAWTVAGMLQSPSFLYRTELGARSDAGFALTDHELASELSYTLCDTMPDDVLLAAADAGTLGDPAVRRAHAERLVASGCAADRIADLVETWLELDLLPIVSRDATIYPELTPELRLAMATETRKLVGELATTGGTLSDLFRAEHTWVNAPLAAHYGVPFPGDADADGFARVDLAGTAYGGLLAHGSFLTTHALPTSSSPIHRGVTVRERLLCQDLPPPPANLNISPPEVDPSLSTRERYAQHAADPACSGCHDAIDPIGFAFEHFDGIGRYRDLDGVHPVDASGAIAGSEGSDGAFYGVRGLAEQLVGGTDLQRCWTRVQVRSAFGLADDAVLGGTTDALATRWPNGALPLQDVLLALLDTPHFTRRVGGADELDAPGVGEEPATGEPPWTVDTGLDDDVAPPDGAALEVTTTEDWGTGYCAEGVVTNHGDTDVTWRLRHDPFATITNVWNAAVEPDVGTAVWFVGADWNATLAPGGATTFGFCAER